ncbi:zf-TFIIB domain-containing protein [Patescibacteria group bacterium]|nr:zf-TFIIB domain-containing protein [Patescibacteria group bacterium]
MNCPACSYTLQKLEVTTNSGKRFEVDHCGRCGGTWFDPYELHRTPYHEVMRLANLTVLPKTPIYSTRELLCPHDHKKLELFKSDSIPAGVSLLRCAKCNGIWATQKMLETVKEYQEDSLSEFVQPKMPFPSLSVVFVPTLLIFLLLASTFTMLTSLQKSNDQRAKAATLLSNIQTISTSSTSITITFQTDIPVSSKISYGTSILEMTTKAISAATARSHLLTLSGLKPDTIYFYTITLTDKKGNSVTTETKSFKTEGNK